MLLANLVSMAHPVKLASEAILASKVLKVKLVRKVNKERNPESLVTQVVMDQQANLVHEVRQVQMESPVSVVQKVIKAGTVHREHLGYPVHLVLLEKWDEKDRKAHLVIKDDPVHMDCLAKMVRLV